MRGRAACCRLLAISLGLLLQAGVAYCQYPRADDPTPWWEGRDSSTFASTGYIGASFGFVNSSSHSFNPATFVSYAQPFWKNMIGAACRVGYNAIPAAVANTWFRQYYISAGPFVTYQLNKKYAFDFRLLGGLMYCQYPEQIYLNSTTTSSGGNLPGSDSTIFYTFDIKGSNAFAFFYQIGLGFRFQLVRRMGLVFNADYMGLRADFNTTITSNVSSALVSIPGATTHSYQFNPNPVTNPLTIEPTDSHHNGYFMCTIGLYYRIGDPIILTGEL